MAEYIAVIWDKSEPEEKINAADQKQALSLFLRGKHVEDGGVNVWEVKKNTDIKIGDVWSFTVRNNKAVKCEVSI